MKSLVLLLFVVGFFEAGFAESDCKKEDIDKIQSCYKNVYRRDLSDEIGPYLLMKPILSKNETKQFWHPFCHRKQKLNDCIGADAIKACYNIPDIQKIPYGDGVYNDVLAKFVIASFIQVDYVCDKYFKLSDADYNCYLAVDALVNTTCSKNGTAETFCEVVNEIIDCSVDLSYKTCGNTVGCYVKQNGALLRCYVDFDCHACDNISSTNNLIDGLCDDDSSKSADENVIDEIASLIDLLKIVT